MNELDMIKLNIFEAYDNGELSYGEKEYLLEQVAAMYEDGWEDGIFANTYTPYDRTQSGKNLLNTKANKAKAANEILRKQQQATNGRKSAEEAGKKMLKEEIEVALREKRARDAQKVADNYNKIRKQAQLKNTGKAVGKAAAAATGIAAIGAGALALKKKYDNSVNGLMKKLSKLEAELAAATDSAQKKVIKNQIAIVKKSIKDLEAKSDRAMKESAFDLLLEEVNDLYYEDAYEYEDAYDEYDY